MKLSHAFAVLLLASCDGGVMPGVVPTPDGGGSSPSVAANAYHLTTSSVVLIGDGNTACSQPPGAGDVWCSFVRGSELWAVNVTRSAKDGSTCDGEGPSCLKLSSTLWMGDPLFSPAYPGINEFSGETLFMYGDAMTANHDDPFAGIIKAWRPGWTSARPITTNKGYLCRGHASASVAYCLDNVTVEASNVEFDLLAGALDPQRTTALTNLSHIRALGPTGQTMWSANFTGDGAQLAYSLPTEDGSAENLQVIETADIGKGQPTQVLPGAAHWRLSSDGTKVYYLDGFNYADRSAKPIGRLNMVDFPSGKNPRFLSPGVGDFQVIADGTGDKGIAILADMSKGAGSLRLLTNRDYPEGQIVMGSKISDYQFSPDLQYSFTFQPADSSSLITRVDGGGSCALNTWTGGMPFLVTFLPKTRAVFFAEDDSMGALQGWYADPEGCARKSNFVTSLAYLLPVGDGVVYSKQDASGRHMNLRHLPVTSAGLDKDHDKLLADNIDTRVAVGGSKWLLFTITDAAASDVGLWAYGPLP